MLSGGRVEDDFLERVAAGGFPDPAVIVCYGEGGDPNSSVCPPCGDVPDVLVKSLTLDCDVQAHLCELEPALLGQRRLLREVELGSGVCSLHDDSNRGLQAERDGERVHLRVDVA